VVEAIPHSARRGIPDLAERCEEILREEFAKRTDANR
jgi:hypothetical protein